MLFFDFLFFNKFRFFQSGFYFDFFFKKLSEIFVRNVFIYSAQYFGEKYFIEIFTKKIIVSFIFNFISKYSKNNLLFTTFFNQILIYLFYLLTFINLFFLFF